ncbi:MAG TPA: GNAT family N-acetyltransferase, partial [Chloroflexota bacterium]|nr:GNAT family N-acetyltransferase [Chloroflexota bacterium]
MTSKKGPAAVETLSYDGDRPRDHSLAAADQELQPSVVDPDDPRWHDFVAHHPDAGPFHQPAWTSAVLDTFGYQPRFHALVSRETARIEAAWPTMLVSSRLTGRRLVCLPFCHRAGPLISSSDQACRLLDALIKDAAELGVATIEARDWPSTIPMPQLLRVGNQSSTHVLDISSGPDELSRNLGRDIRYSIRRAHRNGVSSRSATGNEELEVFYSLYLAQRQRQHLLAQPEKFVRRVYQRFSLTGNAFLVLAEYAEAPVAAFLTICHGTTAVGLDSGTDPLGRSLRANSAAIWRSIEVAAEHGCTRYDFGRSPTSAAGQQHFKREWGANEVDLPYTYCGRPSGINTGNPSAMKRLVLEAFTRSVPLPVFESISG